MSKKIKAVIAKIKARLEYSRCYDYMESVGVAVFGMCGGNSIEDFLTFENCPNCPFFTPIRKDGADNDR